MCLQACVHTSGLPLPGRRLETCASQAVCSGQLLSAKNGSSGAQLLCAGGPLPSLSIKRGEGLAGLQEHSPRGPGAARPGFMSSAIAQLVRGLWASRFFLSASLCPSHPQGYCGGMKQAECSRHVAWFFLLLPGLFFSPSPILFCILEGSFIRLDQYLLNTTMLS